LLAAEILENLQAVLEWSRGLACQSVYPYPRSLQFWRLIEIFATVVTKIREHGLPK